MATTSFHCCSALSPRSNSNWATLRINRTKGGNLKCYQKRVGGIRAEVSFVRADEAQKLVSEEGYFILDIRDETQYERAHIRSSVHVPFFIKNLDNDLGTVLRRTTHNNFAGLLFGKAFTKANPDFKKTLSEQFSSDSKLLVVCQEGLRSAAAATELEKMGFDNIACITSGLESVKPGMFDSVGSTELQNAGKGGLVMIQGKISLVLGSVLISAYLFVTFFPNQAEKILDLAFPR